jgi:hypothetical protein
VNLRHSLLIPGMAVALLLAGCAEPRAVSVANNLAIVVDSSDPVVRAAPVPAAVDQLRRAVMTRGFVVLMCSRLSEAGSGDLCLVVASAESPRVRDLGVTVPAAPLSRVIAPGRLNGREVLLIAGRDAASLARALTETSDAVLRAEIPAAALRTAPTRDVDGNVVVPSPVAPPGKSFRAPTAP